VDHDAREREHADSDHRCRRPQDASLLVDVDFFR
jgi:hypothetical protein